MSPWISQNTMSNSLSRVEWPTRIYRSSVLLATAAPLHAEQGPGPFDSPLNADFQNGFAKGFDAVVLRPLYFAGLVTGAVALIPVAILTSPGGKPALQEAYNTFVALPAEGVFRRPLGDF